MRRKRGPATLQCSGGGRVSQALVRQLKPPVSHSPTASVDFDSVTLLNDVLSFRPVPSCAMCWAHPLGFEPKNDKLSTHVTNLIISQLKILISALGSGITVINDERKNSPRRRKIARG